MGAETVGAIPTLCACSGRDGTGNSVRRAVDSEPISVDVIALLDQIAAGLGVLGYHWQRGAAVRSNRNNNAARPGDGSEGHAPIDRATV